jgi:similar to spore coat protein
MVTTPGAMNDGMIATALLNDCKAGIKNYAAAITETATPEVREVLKRQLGEAIDFHAKVFQYMETKGLYHPRDFQQQIQVDMQNLQQVNENATTIPGSM